MKNENKYWNLENSEERLNLILKMQEFWDWLDFAFRHGWLTSHELHFIVGLEDPSHYDIRLQYNDNPDQIGRYDIVSPK